MADLETSHATLDHTGLTGVGGGSGSITSSGYTQNTAKMLGRTTASSGAIEEITVGTGLSLSAGSLTATASAGNWTRLADTLMGSDTATFDFTSISGSYKHLVVLISARSTESATNTWIKMTFNNDTGSNYDCLQAQMFSGSSSAGFNEDLAATSMAHMIYVAGDTAPAGYVGAATVHIPNYAATTFDKMAYTNGAMILGTSSTNIRAYTTAGFWRSTAAITRITLTPTTGNFKTGSRATLYGLD
jgi:hypothetical protein